MSNRHHGMSQKLQRFLYGKDAREEMQPCPRCGSNLTIGTNDLGQTVERCPNTDRCRYQKLHRGRITTE